MFFSYFLPSTIQVSKCEEKYISDNDRTLFYLENVQTHLIYYDHDAAEIYIRFIHFVALILSEI